MQPRVGVLVTTASLCALASAQDDLRDRVVVENGREIRGRIVTPFAEDEVLVLRGQQRIRVARNRIRSMSSVREAVAELVDRRATAAGNDRFHWMLAEHAQRLGLDALARLSALEVLLFDPDHPGARRMLGHREHPRLGWLWPLDPGHGTFPEYEARHDAIGRALELDSEHFRLRTDAGLRTAVDTLWDLERCYASLFAEYGPALDLHECVERMRMTVYASAEDFPARGSVAIPYFEPRPFADMGYTYLRERDARPVELFGIAAPMILYRCLAGDPNLGDPQDRLCAWAEIGFGRFLQSRFSGEPGYASVGPARLDPLDADLARNARTYRIPNLLHLRLRDHFYGGFGGESGVHPAAVHFASAQAFVQFLLDPAVDKQRPARFVQWLRIALRDAKGDSSSAFDAVLGVPAEQLERPFDEWLGGKGAPRRRLR